MPIAIIAFDFDPLLRIADALVVRWQTIALAIVIAAALFAAGAMARRAALRSDDLLFIAVGIVPGAVIGGRLGYALLHLDYYGADPLAIFDPAGGGLELGLAVAGGLLTAGYVAKLLDAPIGAWLHVAVLPLLFALGAGKLTMVLGGAGQGQPSGAAWATAYLGPGPWASLAPSLPSHPSQAYEGVATLIVLVLAVSILAARGNPSGSPDGRAFFFGVAAWAFVRAAASLTWRDPAIVGPLNAGTLIALSFMVVCLVAAGLLATRRRDDPTAGTMTTAPPPGPTPRSPDPWERPRP